jgi:DNA-binding NarL/FixJ family response regulator
MKRRILIVDDHPIVRQGMRLMINAEPDLEVCGEAETEAEAREKIRKLSPDAAIVDLSLEVGDGFNVVRDIRAHTPSTRVLVLSMHDESIYAERLISEGAAGYIMKQAATDQLITALRTVLKGENYMSESMRERLSQGGRRPQGREVLSSRELQVLHLIGQGVGSREMAQNLSVSVKTIESHRAAVKRKLKLATNAQLVQYAIQWHTRPEA